MTVEKPTHMPGVGRTGRPPKATVHALSQSMIESRFNGWWRKTRLDVSYKRGGGGGEVKALHVFETYARATGSERGKLKRLCQQLALSPDGNAGRKIDR
jgi:hypothetical protein